MIQTIFRPFIRLGRVYSIVEKPYSEERFLNWRSRVVRNFTFSLASAFCLARFLEFFVNSSKAMAP